MDFAKNYVIKSFDVRFDIFISLNDFWDQFHTLRFLSPFKMGENVFFQQRVPK